MHFTVCKMHEKNVLSRDPHSSIDSLAGALRSLLFSHCLLSKQNTSAWPQTDLGKVQCHTGCFKYRRAVQRRKSMTLNLQEEGPPFTAADELSHRFGALPQLPKRRG